MGSFGADKKCARSRASILELCRDCCVSVGVNNVLELLVVLYTIVLVDQAHDRIYGIASARASAK